VRVSAKLIDRRRLRRSLRDYPIYSPPCRRSDPALSRAEMDANYGYFLAQKAARLQHLATFLAAFSLQLSPQPEALPMLERWLDRYGGHLVPASGPRPSPWGDPRVASALCTHEPAWAGGYRGLNVINDIAIFAGDYIVSQNRDARWGMWYGEGEKRDRQTGWSGHPCIFGLRHFGPDHHYSMLMEIFEACCLAHGRLDGRLLAWRQQQPGSLVRRLSYLAGPSPEAVASTSSGTRRVRGAILRHKGVKIYRQSKGGQSSRFWYALVPNQGEDSDKVFDVRRLPRTYRSGLMVEDSETYDVTLGLSEQQRLFAALDAEQEAHMIAIRRAIDDGYDFTAATRGNYGQLVRRLLRSMRGTRVAPPGPNP
jgi:hypothetical protein